MIKRFSQFTAVFLLILLTINWWGCAKKEPEYITIGSILPLTGEGSQYGDACKKGIDLAIEEINQTGGINGKKIRVIYEDDQLKAGPGTQAMNKLVSVDKVKVVLGAVASSVTLAIAPIANQNKVVLFSSVSTSHDVTDAGDYIFRNVASDIYEGSVMAEFAYKELGYRKVALFGIDTAGTLGMTDSFRDKFTALGGEILIYEKGPQAGTDFRTQISKIKATQPEAVYISGFQFEVGTFIKQARDLDVKAQLLSMQPAEDPQVVEIAGYGVNGVIFSTTTISPEYASPEAKEFMAKFEKKYSEKPASFADYAYDAMNIIAMAIKNVGYDGTKIKDFLYTVKDYPGASGKTTFDENGDVEKPIFINTYKDKNIVFYKKWTG